MRIRVKHNQRAFSLETDALCQSQPTLRHIGLAIIIALKASGRDCTNNNELLHKIGVLQRYAMQLSLFTREPLQVIRWLSEYNGCTQRI